VAAAAFARRGAALRFWTDGERNWPYASLPRHVPVLDTATEKIACRTPERFAGQFDAW
jgi:hypothetical protein